MRKSGYRNAVLSLFALAALTACEPSDGDYVEITGGGFQLNYRLAEATYTMVATARRSVPEDTVFAAAFENPADPLPDGAPLIVELTSQAGQKRFSIQSPPVTAIVADQPYTVVLTLRDETGAILETHEKRYSSKVGSDVLPPVAPTIGPGYTPNPAASD